MFNEMLKTAMEDAGMNATALSAATGIGKSSLSQYLSGKVVPPDKKKEQIALAMGLEADYFKKKQINLDLENKGSNLPVIVAARLMGKSKEFVYQGLRDGVFPWGYGVNMNGRWSYYISPAKFVECTGIPV